MTVRVVTVPARDLDPETCESKSLYGSEWSAVLPARRIAMKEDLELAPGQELTVFKCPHRRHWHVGRWTEGDWRDAE